VVERQIAVDRNITRVLRGNAAAMLAILVSYPAFYLGGQWSSVTAGYIAIACGLLALCILALVVANYIDAATGLIFYAWCGFGAIAGMLVLDIANGSAEFPWVLYIPLLGIVCLGRFGLHQHKRLFVAATIGLIVLAGVMYRQYDQAVACAATALLTSRIARG
jgi:hypothetical protein